MTKKEVFIETVKNKLATLKAEVESLQVTTEQIDRKDLSYFSATMQETIAKIQLIEREFSNKKDATSETWYALIKRTESSFADLERLIADIKQLYSS